MTDLSNIGGLENSCEQCSKFDECTVPHQMMDELDQLMLEENLVPANVLETVKKHYQDDFSLLLDFLKDPDSFVKKRNMIYLHLQRKIEVQEV